VIYGFSGTCGSIDFIGDFTVFHQLMLTLINNPGVLKTIKMGLFWVVFNGSFSNFCQICKKVSPKNIFH
jgi:hypothetical protein